MAPAMGIKRSAAGAQTVTLPATAVRDAVRVAVREAAEAPARVPAPAVARDGVLCLEEVDGRRWSYVVDGPGSASVKANPKGTASFGASFKAVPLQSPLPPVEVSPPSFLGFVQHAYCYLPWIWFSSVSGYMFWRAYRVC
jgi:hypothetical protein